ncbi:coagulation factor 5/8 type domain-containing protein [Streptomyces tateyamensis]|uniref:Coagulation factor 5/8 type domain-containing protein n=1 Tax=Streptomyces tateyamensis TaxID=565073 RepID=A0A2V4MY31_9ACTN|nr:discoidin domain-containing protein [Streptomyces tateyamensis]PYC76375.1 coagulation factor 5/8 type domain-containing protein [Streptomyces tateyamensis]
MDPTPRPALRRSAPAPVLALLAVAALVVGLLVTLTPATAQAAPTLLSQGRPATASSTENVGTPASAAVDGNTGTRWSSAFSDPQWLQVDLGATSTISQVTLNWEAAYASGFQLQVSNDAVNWTSVYTTSTGTGGVQNLAVTGTGRYVRMYGTARATQYGYSLWEFQVYGSPATTCATGNAAQGRPATASSTENAGTPASAAVDGNTGTRWSSAAADPQWLQIDLGSQQTVCGAQLQWEAAYATAFQLQVSNDAVNWTSLYSTTTGTGGTQTLALNGTGRYVRMYGTARATQYGYSLWEFQVFTTTGSSPTPTPTPTPSPTGDPFWGDPSTIPPAQNVVMVKVLNRTNGAYPDSQVYWSFNGQTHSIADQPYLDMPANSAGRMYFYLGSPNSKYFDFIEFTVGAGVFNGNTTRVDAFGLPIAMRLHASDGYDVQVGETQSVFNENRTQFFQDFVNAVPQEFKVLAQTQAPYRIIAPGSDPSFQTGGANAGYFTSYAASVGVNAPTSDVFGCAGVLAANAGECAALNRHVATLPQSQWSDPSQYYKAAPANYYAKFWHDHAINGLAYGFPYDDYAGQSSYISHANPQWLEVAVGY